MVGHDGAHDNEIAMNRHDVRELAAEQRFPRVRLSAGTLAGPYAWSTFLRGASRAELGVLYRELRRLADRDVAHTPAVGVRPHGHVRAPAADVTDVNGEQPSAREIGIFFRAIVAAQAHGLELHPAFQYFWFDARDGCDDGPDGWTVRSKPLSDFDLNTDRIEIWLLRGLSDTELFRTVVHELRHAADMALPKYKHLSKDISERRARAFEAEVMRGPRGLKPSAPPARHLDALQRRLDRREQW
jgi:hypothetical protein